MSLTLLVIAVVIVAKCFTEVHRKAVIEDIRRQGLPDRAVHKKSSQRKSSSPKPKTKKQKHHARSARLRDTVCVACGWVDGLRRDGTCPRCSWIERKNKQTASDKWEFPSGPRSTCAGCGMELNNFADPLCAHCRIVVSDN